MANPALSKTGLTFTVKFCSRNRLKNAAETHLYIVEARSMRRVFYLKGEWVMGMYGYYHIGDVVNNWTIISECFKAKSGKDCYRCRCICGYDGNVEGRALA